MKEQAATFTLGELCTLVDLPRRTVRYYIQIGLVDRPEGAGRGARYSRRHLEQLLEIRKWQQAGLSLERIGELLAQSKAPPLPAPPQKTGSVAVKSHIRVATGIELVIDPRQAGLSPESLQKLVDAVIQLCEHRQSKEETP